MEKALGLELTEDLRKQAYELCRSYLAGPWKDIQMSDFNISIMSGGLSNKLYLCSLPDVTVRKTDKVPRRVLLRLYGSLQDNVNQIITELAAFVLLAERRLGPRLYGCFPRGRLEEYIQSRCLDRSDLAKYATSIAKEFAKIHSVHIPVKKSPDTFENFMKQCLAEVKALEKKNQRQPIKINFEEELHWLLKVIDQNRPDDASVVYCHNDLTGGNILLCEESSDLENPKLMLIDFEFGSYNYRSFDIANHFCEWCFLYNTKNYPYFDANLDLYPTRKQQIAFLKAYLDQRTKEGYISKFPSIEAEIETMLDEILLFRLQAHLAWSTWSYKLSFDALPIAQFAYDEYSNTRFKAYKTQKEELLRYRGLNGEAVDINGN